MSELQIFDAKGNVRQFTDNELASVPPDRREKLDDVIRCAKDVADCEANDRRDTAITNGMQQHVGRS